MLRTHRKKGKVLIVVMMVCFAFSALTLASSFIVLRYTKRINRRFSDLQEEVYDNGPAPAEPGGDT